MFPYFSFVSVIFLGFDMVLMFMAWVVLVRFGDLSVRSEDLKLPSENVAFLHVKSILIIFEFLKLHISESLRFVLC